MLNVESVALEWLHQQNLSNKTPEEAFKLYAKASAEMEIANRELFADAKGKTSK